jgi:hypothetical protein
MVTKYTEDAWLSFRPFRECFRCQNISLVMQFERNQAHFLILFEIGGFMMNTFGWERNKIIALRFMYHSVLHLQYFTSALLGDSWKNRIPY